MTMNYEFIKKMEKLTLKQHIMIEYFLEPKSLNMMKNLIKILKK